MLFAIYEWWAAALEEQTAAGIDGWANKFSFFNVLQYITVRAALAFLMAFFVSLAAGPWVIRKLISLKIGQPIRSAEEVHKLHELHGKKAGTPTMGGVLILGSVLLALLFCARLFNPFVAVTACTMTALGLLGFCDDYKKIREKNSAGINARAKLFWQITIALVAGSFIFFKTEISGFGATAEMVKQLGYVPGFHLGEEAMPVSAVSFPLFKKPLFDMGILIIPFFALIIVGCSNAVNLTDGLDGLATGCTVSVGLAFAAIAYLAGHYWMAVEYLVIPHNRFVGELSVVLLALVGASFGFLWFNCHPAKMFMGDTGSLAIGGALGTAAICVKQELMLVIIGGVFVMEALSVILQVGSFKLRGKRIFAMSPIHHHFELRGWHESQVIIRFWILSVVLALIGVALLKVA
jgi:phospho-N-acetylmuramoyl-pentapeptide-transferase